MQKNPAQLYKQRIQEIYALNNPDQDVNALFVKYVGKERDVYSQLIN